MSIDDILQRIAKAGGKIAVANGDLKIKIKRGDADPDLVAAIKSNKKEIVEFLKNIKVRTDNVPAVEKREYYDVYPNQVGLSVLFRYRRVLKKYHLEKLTGAHNIPIIVNVNKLDLVVFEKTLWSLMERHEILRTTFLFVRNELKQKIHALEAVELPLRMIDIRRRKGKTELLELYYKKAIAKVFDITKNLLFNVVIIRWSDDDCRVFFVIDHLIGDDFSCRVLISEAMQMYSAYSKGEAQVLPPNIQSKEYAAWMNRLLSGEYTERAKAFWRERLSDMPLFTLEKYYVDPFLTLGIDRSYVASLKNDLVGVSPEYRKRIFSEIRRRIMRLYVPDGNCFGVQVAGELFEALRALSKSLQTTLYNLVNACVFLLIYKITGRRDIVICIIAMIRDDYRLRGIVGWLTTAILFRNSVSGDQTVAAFVKHTETGFLDYYQWKYCPLDWVLDDLDIALDALGPVSINYIHYVDRDDVVYPDYKSKHIEGDSVSCDMDFCFHEFRNCMKIYISYRTDRFTPATIEYFSECLVEVFRFVVENENETLAAIRNVNVAHP